MPGPHVDGIWIENENPPQVGWTNYFPHNGEKNRKRRAFAVLRNLQRDGWICRRCGEPVAVWRRADALYCGEGCRKRVARARRAWRAW